MFDTKTVSLEWGGKTLTLETGRIARQADGAVLATYGETVVLCAVTAAKSVKEGQDFFPLTVHYQEKFFAAGRIPVLGGLVGATTEGVTTTLGRGGSDFSAAIVGACLGAAEIQIWTDVDGMLTADPRIVKNPQVVPHLSFAEASELAYFGAKVLHPATIQPAVARNIPVRILNSQRPTARGTLITADRPTGDRPLTAVAAKTGVTVVDITSTRMLMAHGFLSRLFAVFERFRTPVDVVTTSEVTVSVTVDDARRLPAIVEALSEFAEVSCEDRMAIVCAVGEGLQRDPLLAAEARRWMGWSRGSEPIPPSCALDRSASGCA